MGRKRRGRGEGSISERPDGLWVADLSIGIGPDGKRQRFRKYAKTKRAAEAALNSLKADHQAGNLKQPSSVTLEGLVDHWFSVVLIHQLEPGTLHEYRRTYKRHIAPLLSAVRVQKISPTLLGSWLSDLSMRKVGVETQRKAVRLLKSALAYAVRPLEIIPRNPAEHLTSPKAKRPTRVPLTFPQVRSYLAAVKGHRLAPLILLAVTTSLREGELLGLQWSDIRDGAIFARHTLKRLKSGTYGLGEITKSASSRRRIDLPQVTQDALAEHRKAMIREGHGSTFVFCTTKGTPINPANLRERFHYPMLQKSGNPTVTFHDLRHTAATMLLDLGVHPKLAQERLGHSTIAMTMDLYSHATPAMGKAVAELLDRELRR